MPRQNDSNNSILAQRFREERLRLNMSPENVAHYCKVSVSSVFSWEAGRSRIPLSAAANLWEHGFNIEHIISGNDHSEKVKVYQLSQELSETSNTINVPQHLLRRYGLSLSVASVFHNSAEAEDLAAPGDMILMSWLPEDDDAILSEMPMAVQLRPNADQSAEFLCRITPMQKGKVKVGLGDFSKTVKVSKLLQKCSAVGKFCQRLFCSHLHSGVSNIPHSKRLKDFVNKI